ncbi:uncharacterized protein BX664DRAFT_336734, partial [Halteromyces radiatus]|uniref:uncharacterized protein n=1 Tax=Halteromyces radiatus TaxID=101107 RepID=UPI00221FD3EC
MLFPYSDISTDLDDKIELTVDFMRRKLPALYVPQRNMSDDDSDDTQEERKKKFKNNKRKSVHQKFNQSKKHKNQERSNIHHGLPSINDKPFNYKQIQELKSAGKCTSCTRQYSKEHRCQEYIQDKAARELHQKKMRIMKLEKEKISKNIKKLEDKVNEHIDVNMEDLSVHDS